MPRIMVLVLLLTLFGCNSHDNFSSTILNGKDGPIAEVKDYGEGFEIVLKNSTAAEPEYILRAGVCEDVTVGIIDKDKIGVIYKKMEIIYANTPYYENSKIINLNLCSIYSKSCPSMEQVVKIGGCP